jgi:hypothetical protein
MLWLSSALVVPLSAQTSAVPYLHFSGPMYNLRPYSYLYPGNYGSIREVDFKNLTVTFWQDHNGRRLFLPLKNGKCEMDFHPGHTTIGLADVHYINSLESGQEHAVVLYEEDDVGGSSNQEGLAQVFALSHNRLRVMQQIIWDLHYGGPFGQLDTFDEKTGTLLVHSSHYMPGDAHCCVSAIDVVTYRWDGRKFVQASIRTELSDHGKREGKRLVP